MPDYIIVDKASSKLYGVYYEDSIAEALSRLRAEHNISENVTLNVYTSEDEAISRIKKFCNVCMMNRISDPDEQRLYVSLKNVGQNSIDQYESCMASNCNNMVEWVVHEVEE
jgi:hypothetical protein